jgi:hypothetical protein
MILSTTKAFTAPCAVTYVPHPNPANSRIVVTNGTVLSMSVSVAEAMQLRADLTRALIEACSADPALKAQLSELVRRRQLQPR